MPIPAPPPVFPFLNPDLDRLRAEAAKETDADLAIALENLPRMRAYFLAQLEYCRTVYTILEIEQASRQAAGRPIGAADAGGASGASAEESGRPAAPHGKPKN